MKTGASGRAGTGRRSAKSSGAAFVCAARIKFLGLGTESSTDNSAGAIIIKGMVDRALEARGMAAISRSCEVPEFKHACLGGVYGMKGAIRHLALDGAGGQAIVVCADIAEYARGSSGEPTQGAGAVAMLLEEEPKLAVVDLPGSGSASDYRIMDFRKPMSRFCGQDRSEMHQVQDFPVFNGKYSTTCYIDETLHALNDMYVKRGLNPADYMRKLQRLVDVAGRRVLAVEDREILDLVHLGPVLAAEA